ncbi:MAG: acetyl-CoA carboxylase, carboxyltransferase subunit beta [Bacteriovoracaceae bacterium]
MGWFNSVKSPKLKNIKKSVSNTPTGLWKKCVSCNEIAQTSKLEENAQVCPYCDHHFRLSAIDRIELLFDADTVEIHGEGLVSNDPLIFTDKKNYKDRLEDAYTATNLYDGTVCGLGKINGQDVAFAIMDFRFMGGSMGVVTGEKVAHVFDQALIKKIPALVISCSGGARMQEGILSLMQMAKTSGARQKLKEAGLPYISVLTDPTTGGCAASFAMLGDINIAEPKALIGFAGPRVIEQSIRQTLPQGFQRSEFLLEHGFIDIILHRHKMKKEIGFFLKFFHSGVTQSAHN